jgi:hypothetical protein
MKEKICLQVSEAWHSQDIFSQYVYIITENKMQKLLKMIKRRIKGGILMMPHINKENRFYVSFWEGLY